MKKFIIACLFAFGCGVPQPTESNVVLHCREDGEEKRIQDLNKLLSEGWRYAGPLSNNGMNCTYILFVR